jgi:hypothetical protein
MFLRTLLATILFFPITSHAHPIARNRLLQNGPYLALHSSWKPGIELGWCHLTDTKSILIFEAGMEWQPRTFFQYIPTAGFRYNFPRIGKGDRKINLRDLLFPTIGIDVRYPTDFYKGYPLLRFTGGLAVFRFVEFSYGYNLPLQRVRREWMTVGPHSLSLFFRLPVL